jgi:hypothetical protein
MESVVKERPILFSAPMVRAILEDRKTQTRRILKQAVGPSLSVDVENEAGVAVLSWLQGVGPGYDVGESIERVRCPYGVPGDHLYVRETWAYHPDYPESTQRAIYRAERGVEYDVDRWTPSIHMPRWASRIDLQITNVRVERLQEISEADAEQEGCAPSFEDEFGIVHGQPQYKFGFRKLWEEINGTGSWDLNPFCWVIDFKRAEKTN